VFGALVGRRLQRVGRRAAVEGVVPGQAEQTEIFVDLVYHEYCLVFLAAERVQDDAARPPCRVQRADELGVPSDPDLVELQGAVPAEGQVVAADLGRRQLPAAPMLAREDATPAPESGAAVRQSECRR